MKTIGILLVVMLVASCNRHAGFEPVAQPTKAEVWAAIQPLAIRYRLEPEFIYALVAAESNFDASAHNGEARGLLQIKPRAWRTVSGVRYAAAVWDWRANLQVGTDYLAYSRSYLHKRTTFSYPLLLAAFHYGLDYVEDRNFDVDRMTCPNNAIYRELWAGHLSPVPPPAGR